MEWVALNHDRDLKVLGDDEFYRLGEVIFSLYEEKIGA